VGVVEKEDPVITGFTFPGMFVFPNTGGGPVGTGKVFGSFGFLNASFINKDHHRSTRGAYVV
jgi:hypothetical protein